MMTSSALEPAGGGPLVIDAGIGVALCVEAVATNGLRAEIGDLIAREVTLFAPTLWRYEVTSILTKAVHFGQLGAEAALVAYHLSADLPVRLIHPDPELGAAAFAWTLRLKRAAAYDSFYLALAERLACPLWTTDRRLRNAADAPWVRYVGALDQPK